MDKYTSQYQNPTSEENYYKIAYYNYFKEAFKNTAVNNTESKKIVIIDESTDPLSFMETFDFPDLDKLKATLSKSKKIKKEEVEEVIVGLKTLPEYRD